MNKKLYVGGLSYSVTDDQLRELFEPETVLPEHRAR